MSQQTNRSKQKKEQRTCKEVRRAELLGERSVRVRVRVRADALRSARAVLRGSEVLDVEKALRRDRAQEKTLRSCGESDAAAPRPARARARARFPTARAARPGTAAADDRGIA